jgi:hypothetical protein
VASQHAVFARGNHRLCDVRREKPLEAAHPFEFGKLLRHALLERAIPFSELGGLHLETGSLLLHRVVQRLDT